MTGPPTGAARPPLRLWLSLFGAMLPLPAVWALANPLFASPDEPAHMVRAQGAARGDFQRPYATDGLPIAAVDCLRFRPEVTADCMDLTWGADRLEQRSTAETYPPLFHAVAGLPAVLLRGPPAAYAMRLWLAVVCCATLAWAAVLLWTRLPSAWSVAAVFLAATPMVVFTMATVNPSGLAAAVAALLWAAGINVTRPTTGTMRRASAVTLLAALLLLPLLRRDGLPWVVLVLAVLGTTLDRARVATLRRDRRVVGAAALVAVGLALTWRTWIRPVVAAFLADSVIRGRGDWTSGITALGGHAREVVGLFGWVDTPMTPETLALWLAALGAVLAAAIATGSRPEARAVLLALLAMVVVPVVIGAIRHPYFQGRYLFPMSVGAMLMAGQALAGGRLAPRRSRRLLIAVVAAAALGHVLAFAQNLRRYAVGASGPWSSLGDAPWQPPMISNAAALLLAAAAIVLALVGARRACGGTTAR